MDSGLSITDAQSTPALALVAGEDSVVAWRPCTASYYDGPRNMVGVRTEEGGNIKVSA